MSGSSSACLNEITADVSTAGVNSLFQNTIESYVLDPFELPDPLASDEVLHEDDPSTHIYQEFWGKDGKPLKSAYALGSTTTVDDTINLIEEVLQHMVQLSSQAWATVSATGNESPLVSTKQQQSFLGRRTSSSIKPGTKKIPVKELSNGLGLGNSYVDLSDNQEIGNMKTLVTNACKSNYANAGILIWELLNRNYMSAFFPNTAKRLGLDVKNEGRMEPQTF